LQPFAFLKNQDKSKKLPKKDALSIVLEPNGIGARSGEFS